MKTIRRSSSVTERGAPPPGLRILQLVQAPQRRGAEVFVSRLATVLRAQGHSVRTVYLYRHDGPGALETGSADRELAGRPGHLFERAPGWHPALMLELLREIGRFRPDIVQVNGARAVKYGALARRLTPRARWRLVYRNIGDPRVWQAGRLRRCAYRFLVLPGVDGIAALSRHNLEAFRELYDYRGPVQVIPNAVGPPASGPAPPDELRALHDVPADAPVLLFVGSLTPEKRPDRLARVAQAVRFHRRDVRLWIVGDGPERARLELEIERRGLGEAARLWGSLNAVGSLYQAADLLLLTSDTEGMPAVVLEAALAGLPTVAPRVGGMASCVRDGETGLLVAAGDEEGLATAALRLVEDGELREALGRRARRYALDHFTMERAAAGLVALYRETLAGRGQDDG